ncbi:MAG TPA: hypothetical protein VIO64_11900 [Pseudobacteroides sp.]|uniref:TolB family protein n=1 Tax=Pseudobacteroides sp. TaxID=1968840 RepID=UPI002F936A2D
MKIKLLSFVVSFLLFITAGCSSDNKVTVIKGAGTSNNSLLVGLSEICPGDVEGFTGERLIVRTAKNSREIEFYSIDIKTKEKKLVFASIYDDSSKLCFSKDFKYALYGKNLISLEESGVSMLASINPQKGKNSLAISRTPDYSFYGEHEVLVSNPIIYLNRYLGSKVYGLMSHAGKSRSRIMKIGDIRQRDMKKQEDLKFENINIPKISSIEDAVIDFDRGRYLFLGRSVDEGKKDLYVLDLINKEFVLIDKDVSLFALSPTGSSIAYVKNSRDRVSAQKLLTYNFLDSEKKELDEQVDIAGVSWSANGGWIAFSGGKTNRNDIFIMKSDGTNKEQLTQGMNSEGSIAWAQSGNKLVFTTNGSEEYKDSRVYLISLNMTSIKETGDIINQEPERQTATSGIISFFREVTQDVIKGSAEKT